MNDQTKSKDHSINPSINIALPLFIIGLIVAVAVVFTEVFRSCLLSLKIMTEEKEVEVDEKLGSYFECLGEGERKRWLAEEVSNRHRLGIQTIGGWTMEKIRTTLRGKKTIKGTANYEILSNERY